MSKDVHPERALRIVIADDHAMFRESVGRLLAAETNMEVVGEACNGEEAVRVVLRLQPDVLLLDLNMDGMEALQALKSLSGKSTTKAILLTADIDRPAILGALEAGVRGLVMKHAATNALIKSIHCVAGGEYWFDREILAEWARVRRDGPSSPWGKLTPLDRRIVRLILTGATNDDIASELSLGDGTVKRRLSQIYKTLGVANRFELALSAVQPGPNAALSDGDNNEG